MKLSVSNIAWDIADDFRVYSFMKNYGYTGLEIAPTRIFSQEPYNKLLEMKHWANTLKKEQGFCIPSMQSIWFGRKESLFGSLKERIILAEYTKKAVDFAVAARCRNLVFGCPRNRSLPQGGKADLAISFFREIGNYAYTMGTVIGMEANPPLYNTNFINDTLSALELIYKVDSKGFRLNLDVGTMIENKEQIKELKGQISYISHVHISEPGLKKIEKRGFHQELKQILEEEGYQGFISVEMGKSEGLRKLEKSLAYVQEVFL